MASSSNWQNRERRELSGFHVVQPRRAMCFLAVLVRSDNASCDLHREQRWTCQRDRAREVGLGCSHFGDIVGSSNAFVSDWQRHLPDERRRVGLPWSVTVSGTNAGADHFSLIIERCLPPPMRTNPDSSIMAEACATSSCARSLSLSTTCTVRDPAHSLSVGWHRGSPEVTRHSRTERYEL
jgi:hypothetical protein